ncbi:hypothetical protein EJ05DRAFT_501139 [Pseudovirgaria hyperparasitica]|uniref:Uncharacterized protein n=1 Tax=Pseudovirgaria hyperparasitica TaxID=470096 RepID=A0A6A6W609_9PEZI|nr:uncharacterized protein EJ05DRAFT_501139 [Pseudovirgaria hyperparasitica]KAF2757609.1 hypothetical protein EJ05DRAFT_501139 [Pseudovirgaria hyperparasitica]
MSARTVERGAADKNRKLDHPEMVEKRYTLADIQERSPSPLEPVDTIINIPPDNRTPDDVLIEKPNPSPAGPTNFSTESKILLDNKSLNQHEGAQSIHVAAAPTISLSKPFDSNKAAPLDNKNGGPAPVATSKPCAARPPTELLTLPQIIDRIMGSGLPEETIFPAIRRCFARLMSVPVEYIDAEIWYAFQGPETSGGGVQETESTWLPRLNEVEIPVAFSMSGHVHVVTGRSVYITSDFQTQYTKHIALIREAELSQSRARHTIGLRASDRGPAAGSCAHQ